MQSILPAVAELERCFLSFAPLFPDTTFPQPVIAIQSKGRRNMFGWFCAAKWSNGGGEAVHEITLTAEHLKRPVEDIAEVLIHEMSHYANSLDGIHDCNVNQYHNKAFRERAEGVGLVVTKRGGRGWAETALGPELLEKVRKANIDPEAFSLFRLGREQKKQPTRMKKWGCGCTIVRAAVELNAHCLKCGKPFVCAGS
jgi:hypothetical protein